MGRERGNEDGRGVVGDDEARSSCSLRGVVEARDCAASEAGVVGLQLRRRESRRGIRRRL